jgi:hypothetical protein
MHHIPPLCFASHTAWQTEAEPTMNKLGQVPFQGHTACLKYMCRDITFGTSIVFITDLEVNAIFPSGTETASLFYGGDCILWKLFLGLQTFTTASFNTSVTCVHNAIICGIDHL